MVFFGFCRLYKKQMVFDFLRLYKKRLPEVFGNLLKIEDTPKGCNLTAAKSKELTTGPRKRYFL